MVLSLAACGDDESSGKRKKKDKEDTSSSAFEDLEKIETITGGTAFSEGIALVSTGYNSETQMDMYAIIDKEGHILSEFETNRWIENFHYIDSFKNGVVVTENEVCDKNGKFVATSEDKGYTKLLTDARTGKILAVKIEENYYGDTVSIGTLDTKGEWIEPLSSTHPLAAFIMDNELSVSGISFNNFLTDEIVMVTDNCYYNMNTEDIKKHYNGYYCSGDYKGDGSFTYNVYRREENEEATLIAEGVFLDNTYKNGFVGYYYDGSSDEPVEYYYFDYQGNEIIKFDASYVYELAEVKGYIIARVTNSTGSFYTCIYKENGEMLVDPMRVNWSLYNVDIWPEYEMLGIDNNYFNFDGEEIGFEGYDILDFGEGLFRARDDNWNNCYLDVKGKKVIG